MSTEIREKTVVKENGRVEISPLDLPSGTEVEVIVRVRREKMDETEYLLSTEANREHLEKALEDLKHPENFIRVDIDELEDLCKK
jgi:antitoxin YefM